MNLRGRRGPACVRTVRSGIFVAVLVAGLAASVAGEASEISGEGQLLVRFLDGLDVEHLWPAGVHVNWETGIPDGKPEPATGKHTHCSAFVAEVAKRLEVYILRPPAHSEVLLANAQYDWLQDRGTKDGWFAIANGDIAQRYANFGYLVVAVYRSHVDNKPGHIAVVRPSEKSPQQIDAEGPEVIQAGEQNYESVSLKRGFAGHPAAWASHEVLYFGHSVSPDTLRALALHEG
jgi:hypothetical protein